jgi:hypothetical protein
LLDIGSGCTIIWRTVTPASLATGAVVVGAVSASATRGSIAGLSKVEPIANPFIA